MFYTVLSASLLIGLMEILTTPKGQAKQWVSYLLSALLMGAGISLSMLIDFEIFNLPSISQVINHLLKAIFPWFYQFMKI